MSRLDEICLFFSVSSGLVSHLSTCKDYLLDFTNNELCRAHLRRVKRRKLPLFPVFLDSF